MSETTKKPVAQALIWGVVAAVLYVTLYMKEDTVLQYFSRGGMYAFLPIATAFLFSFVHGSFTGYFWNALGVDASKKARKGK